MAFRGDRARQDPADEPSAKSLARIRTKKDGHRDCHRRAGLV